MIKKEYIKEVSLNKRDLKSADLGEMMLYFQFKHELGKSRRANVLAEEEHHNQHKGK